MQGLLANAGQGAPAPGPQSAPPPGNPPQPAAKQAQQAKPNQDTYNLFSGQIQRHIWKVAYEKILETFKKAKGKNVAMLMAQLMSQILKVVAGSAMGSGKKIPPQIIYSAGKELVKSLAEIAVKAGALDQQNWEEIAKDAFFKGLSSYAKSSSPDPSEAQQYMQLLQRDQKHIQQQPQPQEAMNNEPTR